jgi:hypothetical protein
MSDDAEEIERLIRSVEKILRPANPELALAAMLKVMAVLYCEWSKIDNPEPNLDEALERARRDLPRIEHVIRRLFARHAELMKETVQ